MSSYIDKSDRYLMSTYSRQPVMLTRGKGVWVWDVDGKRYLDLVAGLAVVNLGHCHPNVTRAIRQQAGSLVHTSNLYHIEPQIELAELLVENSFADKVFFCNSGGEANEAALKLARKHSKEKGKGGHEYISMRESFHGRTLATVTATGQEKFHKGFEPLVPGFHYVPYNDLAAVEKEITDSICAVIVEPIQGEGGVNVPDEGYLKGLRKICDEKNALLIFDEVQTGIGRTGTLFAYESFGVEPDIMTLAKSLANGVPIGACLATAEVAEAFVPGSHAATFGGNPLSTRAGVATIKTLLEGKILANTQRVGKDFLDKLEKLKDNHSVIREVRGRGLILAMELEVDGISAVDECRDQGFLINCTQGNVLRFIPPLILRKKEVDLFLPVLEKVIAEL
jgi:predicted acetylornithine/succinylornithine family transaminase